MNGLQEKCESFLSLKNMHPRQTDIRKTMIDIISDMERGLRGEPSSLAMIPTYISARAEPVEGESVIVVDAGGTNLRVGLCSFQEGRPVLTDTVKYPIPGSCGELTAQEFFSEIADKILPLTDRAKSIGMCFSYPADIFPNRDGSIIRFNKELRVRGAQGAVIGREILRELREKGCRGEMSFTLLNDTTGGLMGHIAEMHPDVSGGMAGLVLGTGCNCCYFERGNRIKKIKNAGDMIINCELGCFDRCARGEADLILDEASEIPGDHLLEKMCSGAYLGGLITITARLAAQAGLLSERFRQIEKPFTSLEADDFLRGKKNRISPLCLGQDAEILNCLISGIYERAARVVCAMVAAVCEYSDSGKSADKPFIVVAEGSTFWSSMLFKDRFMAVADEFISGELSRHIEIVRSDNATLEGAALAVFTSP